MNLFDTTIKTAFNNSITMIVPVAHTTVYDEDLNDIIEDAFACSFIHF